MKRTVSLLILQGLLAVLTACQPVSAGALIETPAQAAKALPTATAQPEVTPYATRPAYPPGELVDYVAQTGDTLPALAAHFNTRVEEIQQANQFIPATTTTMPPGMPMKILIYFAPFWGTPYQIIPDQLFVNGPAQVGFQSDAFIRQQPGWLSSYYEYAADANRSAGEIVDLVAQKFSVSPRLLLALLEYQSGALTQAQSTAANSSYPLGYQKAGYNGVYLQLVWAANALNNYYYAWRDGSLVTFDHLDGRIDRPDPWQNAASVALQVYFSLFLDNDAFAQAVGPNGLAAVYRGLFGDPWTGAAPHIPGSLEQPTLLLPFKAGSTWALTGGPHTAWGEGEPLAAIDLAPGLETGGCTPTDQAALAMAAGVVVRSEPATVLLDLDGDGDERTGWVLFYFHLATEGRAPVGTSLKLGDPVGLPSCEGGRATGTHVHIARKYNGEWIPAGGVLAFNLEGWVAAYGSAPYLGTLTRFSRTVTACSCSDAGSHITAGEK